MGDYVNITPEMVEEQMNEGNETASRKSTFVFDEKNYLNTSLGSGEREKTITVRILPISADDGHAWMKIRRHSLKVSQDVSKSGFKNLICIDDPSVNEDATKDGFERTCPLCKKARELFDKAKQCTDEYEKRDLENAAKGFLAKDTYMMRVIERGHEDDGPKFWRFNHHKNKDGVLDEIINLYNIRAKEAQAAGQEQFNIFDLEKGKDIVITLRLDPTTKKTTMSITDSGFVTPLSPDPEKIKTWVNDPRTWRDVYTVKNADYLSVLAEGGVPFYDKELQKFVAKSDTPKQDTPAAEVGTPDIEIPSYGGPEDNDLPF